MKAHQAEFAVATQCRALGISESGYYASVSRAPSVRELEDGRLLDLIRASHAESRGTYGARRVHADLVEAGEVVGRDRVARLMRAEGLQGVSPRKWAVTTQQDPAAGSAPDLVERKFKADAPNKLWVADITYIDTVETTGYLSLITDAHSRRIMGYHLHASLHTDGVTKALLMALRQRKTVRKLIHHSDRGSQYAAGDYRKILQAAAITQSMSRKANCWDNAPMESFFGTLKTELVRQGEYPDRDAARRDLFAYIEAYYNRRRIHSAIGYITPEQADRKTA